VATVTVTERGRPEKNGKKNKALKWKGGRTKQKKPIVHKTRNGKQMNQDHKMVKGHDKRNVELDDVEGRNRKKSSLGPFSQKEKVALEKPT